MEAGQKFFTAHAGLNHDRAYASVYEHESIGSVAGVVAFRQYGGSVVSCPESDALPTREAARAACVQKLLERKRLVVAAIDAEIAKLEEAQT